MELANTFNHAGCIFFERKRYDEAYDAFCGALQALVISNGDSNLAPRRKSMLLLDPCVHRAYDRIDMAGLFQSSNQEQQEVSEGDDNDSPSGRLTHPQHEKGQWGDHNEETYFLKAIMIPFAPAANGDESSLVGDKSKQQHFVTAMTVVWMNKGLVLQRGRLRNLGRSLSCYALASQWLSTLEELKTSVIVQGLYTTIVRNTDKLLTESSQ